jgi:GNAT superfamily N-acetyltransferase
VEFRQTMFEVFLARGLGPEFPWRLFVGRVDGKAVSIAEMLVGAGAVGVHLVVTLPEARRQGFAAALTSRVLEERARRGYRVGVLTASPEGYGVYRKIGFAEFGRTWRYEWEP